MENYKSYLQSQNKSPITIKEYSRQIRLFIDWYGDDELMTVQKKDILNYLGYLKNDKKLQTISSNHGLIALRHYFNNLIQQNEITQNPTALIKLRGLKKRRLYYIYNLEELTELADTFYQLQVKTAEEKATSGKRPTLYKNSYYAQFRNYTMLQLFSYQGLTSSEILHLKTTDIQLHKASITITPKTRGNTRTLALNALQIGSLMQYLNQIRPQLINADYPLLFLPTQKGNEKGHATRALIQLTKVLKKTNPHFASLAQIRASIITYWIQTYGLRKAQYFAGHKSINSTEEYLPNVIEDLADDITKFNPFT